MATPEPPALVPPGQVDLGPAPPGAGGSGAFTETPATGAWAALTSALGHDLQRGMHRAEQARRRLSRLRV